MAAAAPSSRSGMSEAAARRGRDLEAEAAKKLAGFFARFNSGRYEEASELYAKAAAQFKIAKDWQAAGDAYVKAAKNCELGGDSGGFEAMRHYVEAARAFKHVSANDAIEYFTLAVQMQMENNRFTAAAKLYKEIAMLQESEGNIGEAVQAYKEAAECFFNEDSKTSGNQMLLKVGEKLMAGGQDLAGAKEIFEQVANASLDNKLTVWSVKSYLWSASVCAFTLAARKGDMSAASNVLAQYEDLHPSCRDASEFKLMHKLVEAFEEKDVEKFTDAVYEFDRIQPLDDTKSGLLLEVKRAISASAESLDDEADEPVKKKESGGAGGAGGGDDDDEDDDFS